jgi:hypothetical protein
MSDPTEPYRGNDPAQTWHMSPDTIQPNPPPTSPPVSALPVAVPPVIYVPETIVQPPPTAAPTPPAAWIPPPGVPPFHMPDAIARAPVTPMPTPPPASNFQPQTPPTRPNWTPPPSMLSPQPGSVPRTMPISPSDSGAWRPSPRQPIAPPPKPPPSSRRSAPIPGPPPANQAKRPIPAPPRSTGERASIPGPPPLSGPHAPVRSPAVGEQAVPRDTVIIEPGTVTTYDQKTHRPRKTIDYPAQVVPAGSRDEPHGVEESVQDAIDEYRKRRADKADSDEQLSWTEYLNSFRKRGIEVEGDTPDEELAHLQVELIGAREGYTSGGAGATLGQILANKAAGVKMRASDWTALTRSLKDVSVLASPRVKPTRAQDRRPAVMSEEHPNATAAKPRRTLPEVAYAASSTSVGTDASTLRVQKNAAPLPGWHDVIVHGRKTDGTFHPGGDDEAINADTLAAAIRANPAYKGQPIRLLSCWTGEMLHSSAQELADNMGVGVIAPSVRVGIPSAVGALPGTVPVRPGVVALDEPWFGDRAPIKVGKHDHWTFFGPSKAP